jgi:carboxyl-terminal processing protease
MKRRLHFLFYPTLILTVLLFGLIGGVGLDRAVLTAHAQANTPPAQAGPNLELIQQAWDTINRVYVDRSALQSTPLTYGAIGGMVAALGDTGHSTFLTPLMVQEEKSLTQGQFTGVGIEVQSKDGNVLIVAPIDGSPAQRAGLKPGEVIMKVDGMDVTGVPLDQVVQRILGQAGTSVTLTVLDPASGQISDVRLVRAKIVLDNVSWAPIPGTKVADLRIGSFSQGVTQDLVKALTEIKQQGMTGIVLDLRNNPGGLLDESVGTASEFLKSGDVLLQKDSTGKETPVPVKPGGEATDLPMVVLVNGGTASAAEIVSGALQDANRATLLGETTFGTGTVLNQFPLSDGSALLLATQEWLTPNGRVIWHKGIAPDVQVALPLNVTPLTPEAERGMTVQQVQASGDAQLLRALSLLQGGGKN